MEQKQIEAYLMPPPINGEQAGQLARLESSVLAQIPESFQANPEVRQLVRYCLTHDQLEQLAEAIALMHRQQANNTYYVYNITIDARHWIDSRVDKRDCSSVDNTSTYTEISGHGNTVMTGDGNSREGGFGWVVCVVILTIVGLSLGGK